MLMIGIDIGTTNCKVCLFELPTFRLANHYRFATPVVLDAGFTRFDVEQIWSGIQFGIREVTRSVHPDSGGVHSISVASVGQSIVLIDSQGQAIGPAITWYDKITEQQAEIVREAVGTEKLYGITGIPSHSNHSLTKLLWISEHYPEETKAAHRWLCLSGYIVYRLTGEMRTEFSLASRTLAYDIVNKRWSEDILRILNFDAAIFPEVVESGVAVGFLLPGLANELGLGTNTLVAIAGHDHIVGSYCTDLQQQNEILNSTGTTEGLLITMKEPRMDSRFLEQYLSNGIFVNPRLYTLYGSMPTAGYAVEWFRRLFTKDEDEWTGLMAGLEGEYKECPQALFNRLSAFVPHLRGSGPPNRRLHAKAMFYGLTEETTKSDILYAILSGLCFELKDLFQTFEDRIGQPYTVMKVIGPATRNPLWLQLKADILNCEVHAFQIEESVAKGAAVLAAVKQKLFDGIASIPLYHQDEVYTPNAEMTEHYKDYYLKNYFPMKQFKRQLE
ncbi:hypothetical protein L1N85_25120 [Paenibacillus alkaliterrae]|uniref:FGGY-family carbohydrate kinase n=1 Tax=Paenibacillus alkaliterrae TaxID=320909 RepID=UPI001EFF0A95|nr:FGGY family carbohydrate kinase [Paenibacillus alkaliterrae]MCF2941621.1 hypothetical protein [Paenibacillus alkaliterrae]